MVFRWHAVDGPTLNAGLAALSFFFFWGGGGEGGFRTPASPLDPPMLVVVVNGQVKNVQSLGRSAYMDCMTPHKNHANKLSL